jgi:glucose/arabinose dehydrogenase
MSVRRLFIFAVLAACGDGGSARADVTPPQQPGAKLMRVPADIAAKVELREVAKGLARPVALVAAPGDARKRLFIVEQHVGRIRFLEGGKLSPKVFFKIGGLSTGNEEGLLGLAFHPKFADNGKLYVNYTSADMATHIVEYRVGGDPDAVDTSTKREIIVIAQPYSNHNGGNLVFGPDGKLYTGMGDGGYFGDPKRNGQNPRALLAKLLRFNVDAARPTPEIVHIGLRNPWRFSFDEPTGGLYIGDVGQDLWENVYVVSTRDDTRHNFGWNIVEGNHCYNAQTCDRTGFTPPVADYPHGEGCSVTGGFVYRGKALPMLTGRYFYADYCTGILRSFVWTAPSAIREHWDWKAAIDKKFQLQQIASFGVDHDGELYIVELTGAIYELVPKA